MCPAPLWSRTRLSVGAQPRLDWRPTSTGPPAGQQQLIGARVAPPQSASARPQVPALHMSAFAMRRSVLDAAALHLNRVTVGVLVASGAPRATGHGCRALASWAAQGQQLGGAHASSATRRVGEGFSCRAFWSHSSGEAAFVAGTARGWHDGAKERAAAWTAAVRRYNNGSWGGYSSRSELNPDRVLYGLIGANVAVYGLWQIVDTRFMKTHFTVSETALRDLRFHTLVTSAFSHFDIWHLGANMLSLYYFGGALGSLFGGTALLQLYLVGGVVSSLSHVAYFHYKRLGWGDGGRFGFRGFLPGDPPGLGASGAVNAVILLNTLLWPTRVILVNFFIPVPAIAFGGLALFRDVYMAHSGAQSGIGHAAHIGGAGVGLAAWMLVRRRGRFTW